MAESGMVCTRGRTQEAAAGMKYVLGLSAFYQDSAASRHVDSETLVGSLEERATLWRLRDFRSAHMTLSERMAGRIIPGALAPPRSRRGSE